MRLRFFIWFPARILIHLRVPVISDFYFLAGCSEAHCSRFDHLLPNIFEWFFSVDIRSVIVSALCSSSRYWFDRLPGHIQPSETMWYQPLLYALSFFLYRNWLLISSPETTPFPLLILLERRGKHLSPSSSIHLYTSTLPEVIINLHDTRAEREKIIWDQSLTQNRSGSRCHNPSNLLSMQHHITACVLLRVKRVSLKVNHSLWIKPLSQFLTALYSLNLSSCSAIYLVNPFPVTTYYRHVQCRALRFALWSDHPLAASDYPRHRQLKLAHRRNSLLFAGSQVTVWPVK